MPRKRYDAELAGLEQHYERVARWAEVDELRAALLTVASGPALFVGTGGTMAVARLAAHLHQQVGGQPGHVVTPLELAALPAMARSGVVLFSAGLRHPDALGAVERLASNRLRPAVVVTLRADAAEVVPPDVRPVVLPALGFREGFLATTSVLVMAAALVRAYGGDGALPAVLPRPDLEAPVAAEQLLVLTTPGLAAVATDIETRWNELGLAPVQVTDYRNFAHGRHVGLVRRADTTSVLALIDEPLEQMAMATLDVLPADEIAVSQWRSAHRGPAGVIELLVASMQLAASVAAAQGLNPARPGAAPFGRRLYHLRIGRLLPPIVDGPVERKLTAVVATVDAAETRARFEEAFRVWSRDLGRQIFGAVVLDYDGTVCATGRRYDLPDEAIQTQLIRLLEHGIALGFASGRGPSLHRDLRKWVPQEHWSNVVTGMYNGGACLSLDEDVPDLATPTPPMEAVVHRLDQLSILDALVVEPRARQVTVSVRPGAFARLSRLAELLVDAMSQPPELPVKILRSGHSVDIVPIESSKRSVVDRMVARTSGAVIAIGDQGDFGGNDFELLASTPWTLTVDTGSPDPTRCWYLDAAGRAGPELLAAYLEAMEPTDGGFAMRWAQQ